MCLYKYVYTEKNVFVKQTKRSNQNGILMKSNRISVYNQKMVIIIRNSDFTFILTSPKCH